MEMKKRILNNEEIGIRIRLEREKLGLSRETFAEMIELSSFYVGQLERGERQMSIETLTKVSNILNLSVDYILFGYTYYMEGISVLEAFDDLYKESISADLKDLLTLLKGSSKNQISLVKEVCKLLLPSIKK